MEATVNKINIGFDELFKSNKGSISACKRCSGFVCCGDVREGGRIEPPFLTKHDLGQISFGTGLGENEFARRKTNPITGNKIYIMRTLPYNGCIFFDKYNGRCKIHSFRPLDCRLFPLDINFENNKYYWVLFKYYKCALNDADLNSLFAFKDEALFWLGEEIHDYATVPVPGMTKVGYKTLTEVKL